MRRLAVGLMGLVLLMSACGDPSSVSVPRPVVSLTHEGANRAAVFVRASDYRVIVTAKGPAWVHSVSPGVQNGEMFRAGQSRTYSPADGKVSLTLGSAELGVMVEVNGRTVWGGSLAPKVIPATLNFSSVS
jgi:hypothetical protein